MGNSAEDNFKWLNTISSRSLRELTYLLCSAELEHETISKELHYPLFLPGSDSQYGLNFYEHLDTKKIAQLEEVDPRTALGRYAERLLAAWFRINPNYELLEANFQLIENNITLGEIDFLLWEKENEKAIHLEFALKYYLKTEQNGRVRYIGPKGKDNLEGKAKKLVDNQLQQLKDHINLLPPKLRDFQYQSRLMLKGFIFHPHTRAEDQLWIKRSEIEELRIEASQFYFLENIRDWIYPFDPIHRKDPYSIDSFKERIRISEHLPIMLVIEKKEKLWLLMVVEDGWPDQFA